ncbi:MAG: histone deacetylase [Deltaproteobacteria bacterium]|nr:histone deacetylase [Deltaproteobacteria bacterium]
MLKAKNRTGLVFFPAFDWAIAPTHPEREERLLYTQDQVFEEGIFDIDGIIEFKPDLVSIADVQRAHFCVPDEMTVMTESHFISAGGAKTIGKAVLEKRIDRGFALVRPPGHHARRVVHGSRGFCNVNIEAIMIEHLRSKFNVKKVAVVDTDCHHGDGTQNIYWHDPDILFISIHQDGRTLYPGSGFTNELGGPNAFGKTLNIPLPPNTSEEGFLYTIKNVVLPILDDFKPDLIVNSAGQDNHYSDPITNMNFSAQGYADLTSMLKADIAVLEGGYSIEGALPYVNTGIILAMAGIDYKNIREPDYDPERYRQSPNVTRRITETCDTILDHWHNVDKIKEGLKGMGEFVERAKKIFYDTDGITELQQEKIRICNECGGAFRIDSKADTGYHILAIHIPMNACSKCSKTGHQWYEKAEGEDFQRAYLQDRPDDKYYDKKL